MDEERILSMSAFEAASLIRSFREKNPTLGMTELVATLRALRADFYPHDFEAGATLEEQIPAAPGLPTEAFFTAAIDVEIRGRRPLWARLAPSGRNHVLQAIGVNGVQCLRAAGLLNTNERATNWWDALAATFRGERDAGLLAQGRQGERLSLSYEAARLRRQGIVREPVWVAIDDNTVGYDILSYAFHGDSVINRLIEVKTTQAEPPRLILSRNEWNTAEKFGHAFQFHLWQLPAEKLIVLSVDDIRLHVPRDAGRGKWQSLEIKFESDALRSMLDRSKPN